MVGTVPRCGGVQVHSIAVIDTTTAPIRAIVVTTGPRTTDVIDRWDGVAGHTIDVVQVVATTEEAHTAAAAVIADVVVTEVVAVVIAVGAVDAVVTEVAAAVIVGAAATEVAEVVIVAAVDIAVATEAAAAAAVESGRTATSCFSSCFLIFWGPSWGWSRSLCTSA